MPPWNFRRSPRGNVDWNTRFWQCRINVKSFPTRERGLKSWTELTDYEINYVVPHAGTWIEIHLSAKKMLQIQVVPHAGTWIEILLTVEKSVKQASFPTRERGLKYRSLLEWHDRKMSFPTRERGLKSGLVIVLGSTLLSFPTRERGLKFQSFADWLLLQCVVPHAGTWIEIFV